MTEETIDEILARFKKTMEMILPIYEEVKPYKGFAGIVFTVMKSLNKSDVFSKQPQKIFQFSLSQKTIQMQSKFLYLKDKYLLFLLKIKKRTSKK